MNLQKVTQHYKSRNFSSTSNKCMKNLPDSFNGLRRILKNNKTNNMLKADFIKVALPNTLGEETIERRRKATQIHLR